MTTTQLGLISTTGLEEFSWGGLDTTVPGSNNYSTPADAPVHTPMQQSGGKRIEDTKVGGFFNMLLSNGGNIAQIISAVKGNKPTVQDGKGNSHDLTEVRSELQKISAQKNQDMSTVMQMMMMQLQNGKNTPQPAPAPKKDNKPLYIGLAVGGAVLVGALIYVSTNKKKK